MRWNQSVSRYFFLGLMLITLGLSSSPLLASGPYTGDEIKSVQSSDEAKIQSLRAQEIQQIRIALGRHLAKNRQAELYFRLAEAYLENYRSEFLFEGRVHEKRLEKGIKEPSIRRERSKPYLALGLKASEDIQKLKIPFDRMDQIYYFLGFNYSEMGDRKKSKAYYELLVQKFPQSVFAVEGLRALGESAFNEGDFKKARSFFERAVQGESAENLPRILYKLAWTHYRLKEYSTAVSVMKKAIEKAQATGEKFLILREEALRDMATFYTEGGKVEEAIDYFEDVAGNKEYLPKVLERLSEQYERTGKLQLATQVYQALLKIKTNDAAQFRVRVKLFDIDVKRTHFDSALNYFKEVKIPSDSDQPTLHAVQSLRSNVRKIALEHHQHYRKKNDRNSLKTADRYYTFYIERFFPKISSKEAESAEVRMYLAEVKREQGLSKEAAEIYKSVIDSGDARFAKEAGSLWTASLSEALRKSAVHAKSGSAAKGKPSEQEMEFVDAADALQRSLGKTDQAREAALRAAQILAGYSETRQDGYERAHKVFTESPNTPQALIAARLCLQILADQSSSKDQLKDLMEEIRKNAVLVQLDKKGKLTVFLDELDAKFRLEKITAAEKKEDFIKAAQGYEEYAAFSNQPEVVEKALDSALNTYLKAKDYAAVNRVAVQWAKRSPDSGKALEALRVAATSALIQGKFEDSAKFFETISQSKKRPDPDSLLIAARIYEGSNQPQQAASARLLYLRQHPKESPATPLMLEVARTYEAQGRDSDAEKLYQSCSQTKSYVSAECQLRLGDMFWKAKDPDSAVKMYKKSAHSDAQSPYVGYARYKLAEMEESRVSFAPLSLPEAKLKAGIGQRVDFLKKITKSYQEVVDAGGPWGIAALGRLAAFTAKFAEDMDAIEGSPEFKKGVKGISDPLRQKAVETWKRAYDIAVKSEALSPILSEIVDEVADAKQSPPARAQGTRGGFRLAGISPDGGDLGAEKAMTQVRAKLVSNAKDSNAWLDYGNLLWGEKQPALAQLAYERAALLNPKSPAALNNQAVVMITSAGEEDWALAAQVSAMLNRATQMDHFFIPAKLNRGLLLNYYRVFPKARALLEQVQAKSSIPEAEQGLMIAAIGMADLRWTADRIKSNSDFVNQYHKTSLDLVSRKINPDDCVSRMRSLEDSGKLQGFEKQSVIRLLKRCQKWAEKH